MENVDRFSSIENDGAEDKVNEIVGGSAALKFVLAEVQRVAPTDSTVLVLGETGTGKERSSVHQSELRSHSRRLAGKRAVWL